MNGRTKWENPHKETFFWLRVEKKKLWKITYLLTKYTIAKSAATLISSTAN